MKTCIVYIPCSWLAVPRQFFTSFLNMISMPVQTHLKSVYGVQLKFMVSDTFPLDRNRNEAVELAVERYKADYILFIDADMVFPKETLLHLFETIQKAPIVTGNYHKKHSPHQSVAGWFSAWNTKINGFREILQKHGFVTESGDQCLFYTSANDWRYDKPFEIHVSGMGCVLVDCSIFEHLKQPYFKYLDTYMTGDMALEGVSEDIWFYTQCFKAGIKILCDPRVQCGHLVEREITFMDQENIVQPIQIKEPILMEPLVFDPGV